MSRIEKALEKAAQLRQKGRETISPAAITDNESPIPLSAFNIGAPIIDPAVVNKHIVCITDPLSSAAEQYRKLRARIFKTTEKDFLNSLLVASALDGEGKTVTAINLAVTMAQEIDHTVLLIDANLRKPSIHKYLGLEPQYGLSDCLQSKVPLSDILIKTGIGKLVLLPAGTPPNNPSELLASEKMRDLVREMKYRYRDRYIIFDSSPLLTTADGLYLKEYIDGVIFVVQAAKTPAKSASQALSLIKGTHVFGTVFNSVPQFLSTRGVSYHERSQFFGEAGALNAAVIMERAEKLLGSLRTFAQRDGLRTIGRKVETSMGGIVKKWTKKK